jgi:MFS family permease
VSFDRISVRHIADCFGKGMGVGSLSMIVPMYNAEIAPPEVRGALVGLQQLSITLGIMISFWIDYGTVSEAPINCVGYG